MPENESAPTSDEVKAAFRPAREVLARLGDDLNAESARDALDSAKDHALQSIESAPASYPGTAISGH